jgi:hypothetical protein
LINTKNMFLLDSGAQFRDGTTDVTRVCKFSSPFSFEREAFTRVLSGHISLAQAVFPAGTVGPTLDAFARQSLWSAGLDYVHGTGHGVGAFLNVHEGPIGISSSGRSHSALTTSLQAGMVLSNGPLIRRSATPRLRTGWMRGREDRRVRLRSRGVVRLLTCCVCLTLFRSSALFFFFLSQSRATTRTASSASASRVC